MKVLPQSERPLDGLVVVDFSQFLSGPLCGLKLADLGARVIKVERPGVGDLCRNLYLSDTDIDGDNSLFHAINRNKESITADLRDPKDRAALTALIRGADVMIQNFRPGVIERQGFGYETVREINPRIIYGSISGYGEEGPWKDLPGQDLLAQARSGLLWLTGSADHAPMPMGLAVADMLAGNALAQGILAALVGRGIHGRGAHVQTSLLEAMIDFQFEVLSTHLNDGHRLPQRSAVNGAHAYLGAPYGVYQTRDGFIALAMTPSLKVLADLLQVSGLDHWYDDPKAAMADRDTIKAILAAQLRTRDTADWLAVLQPADIWCSEVLDWADLRQTEAYRLLDLEQTIIRNGSVRLETLRSPIRMNGATLKSDRAAPELGQDTQAVLDRHRTEDATE
ncbi:CaiB/BaiF CoA transferase family protein [Mameliella sediminis]|uniref:CaiB/BaiF CoA transferase family protein n=1 Tax=Mameliella sediminis TaxID=2836866 RepID=UPI001C48CFAA|nr:CaiB/BaiF CoA-transferase family protein [Mameliella sediminis]MBY6116659.1 CoA transferase [Antarctobacter heliothermus]MBY6146412.1 CoA transferase [Mameliella alba]MBV7396752.1 CoA transferase [Mameliella sediminis]MBY6163042.1 CoA transferase [Mameliella alba]MBY6171306.1 CoA transferase [Mameliella alba]